MCTVLLPPGDNPTAVNKYFKYFKYRKIYNHVWLQNIASGTETQVLPYV